MHVAAGLEAPAPGGAALLGDRDPAGPAVVGVVGALEQPAVLELPGVPADGGRVEAERLGERGEPHRALVAEQLEDREGRVVDDVAGLALPQPAAERHHQAHQRVLGGLRRRDGSVSRTETFACGKHTSLCVQHACFSTVTPATPRAASDPYTARPGATPAVEAVTAGTRVGLHDGPAQPDRRRALPDPGRHRGRPRGARRGVDLHPDGGVAVALRARRRAGAAQGREPPAHRVVQDPRRLPADVAGSPTEERPTASSPPAPATTPRASRWPRSCSASRPRSSCPRARRSPRRRRPAGTAPTCASTGTPSTRRWSPPGSSPTRPGRC